MFDTAATARISERLHSEDVSTTSVMSTGGSLRGKWRTVRPMIYFGDALATLCCAGCYVM